MQIYTAGERFGGLGWEVVQRQHIVVFAERNVPSEGEVPAQGTAPYVLSGCLHTRLKSSSRNRRGPPRSLRNPSDATSAVHSRRLSARSPILSFAHLCADAEGEMMTKGEWNRQTREQMSPGRPRVKLTQQPIRVHTAGAVGGKSCDAAENDRRSGGRQVSGLTECGGRVVGTVSLIETRWS